MRSSMSTPIPGANFTSDKRNQPWHRPPDIATYDETVDYLIKSLEEPTNFSMVVSLLEMDVNISSIVATLLLRGVSRGKFGIDTAILAAGPLARYIEIQARYHELDHDLGVGEDVLITPSILRSMMGVPQEDGEPEEDTPVEAPKQPSEGRMGGLMAKVAGDDSTASAEEQASMLGDVELEEGEEDGMA